MTTADADATDSACSAATAMATAANASSGSYCCPAYAAATASAKSRFSEAAHGCLFLSFPAVRPLVSPPYPSGPESNPDFQA